MESKRIRNNNVFIYLMWFLEGIVVGFGAILPGVSGGTLCVAFGMYRPIVETISNIKNGIINYGFMLGTFLGGIAVGFIGLSGVAAVLLEKNTTLVTYVFVGFIIGTFPELWKEAGKEGRTIFSIISVFTSFAIMLCILVLFKTTLSIAVVPDIRGYLLCGLLWGLSFIVPGLSSSSLLLFFGLYQPMLEGISKLDFSMLIPMGIGMGACVLFFSKAVGFAYNKFFSVVSHSVLGIVAASSIMIIPPMNGTLMSVSINFILMIIGAVISYFFTCVCNKFKSK